MNTKHLTYLDSLRGLAALTVIFSHYIVSFWYEPGLPTGYAIGELAVCLFFVLSGFVLSYRFLGEQNTRITIIEAIIKRPFRLLGVVWATIILGTIIFICVQGRTIDSFACKTWTQYVIDFFCSPFATGVNYNGVLWTISWELWGSMLVFGTLFCIGHLHKYIRMIVFVGLLLVYMNYHYGEFIIGMLIADLHKNFYNKTVVNHRNLLGSVVLITIVISAIIFYIPTINNVLSTYINNGAMVITAVEIFIFTLLNTVGFRTVLNWKYVNFLGNISYGFYAIHYLIMKLICGYICRFGEQFVSKELAWIVMIVVSLPIIVFVAWVVDVYIDKPSIKFASVISKKCKCFIQSYGDAIKLKMQTRSSEPNEAVSVIKLSE